MILNVIFLLTAIFASLVFDDECTEVSKTVMYSISRELKSYQRIFNNCILRELTVDFINKIGIEDDCKKLRQFKAEKS